MLVGNGQRRTHRAWSSIAVGAVIAFLFAMWAAPMSAAGGSAQLSSVSVTPRTGTPKTQIVITVV